MIESVLRNGSPRKHCRTTRPRAMNWVALLIGATLTIVWTISASADFLPGVNARNLTHDGKARLYDVHAPASYNGVTAVPLVIDMHGLGSSKTQQRVTLSGWAGVSETEGFIVAYPQGLHGLPGSPEATNPAGGVPVSQIVGPSWNAGDFCCGDAFNQAEDDAGFIHQMIVDIASEGNIDTSRVYLTGLSNGGAMTQTLACEGAHLFAAFAPVAFPGAFDPQSSCVPSRPVPIITFQGTTDELVPYGGGELGDEPGGPVILSAQATFNFWRDTDSCSGSTPDQTEIIGSQSMCERYTSCSAGTEVELCSVQTPNGSPLLGHILYFNNDNVNVPQRSWDFMSQHSLPPVDISGSWQLNYTCNDQTGHTGFSTITENTTTGVIGFSGGAECGSSSFGAQIVPLESCTFAPDPIPGLATGITFSTPTSGFASFRNDYETPVVYPFFCGTTPIAALEGEFRSEGIATEFAGSTATRIEGLTHFGVLDFLDEFDTTCLNIDLTGGAPSCTFYALRNDVSVGTNVAVEPIDGGTITFDTISTPGTVEIIVTTETSVVLPPTFQVIDPPIFYVIETSATFTGDVEVCLPYPDDDDDGIVDGTGINELTLQMLHDGVAPSVQYVNGVDNKVCGQVSSFSEFVLGITSEAPLDGLSGPAILILCFALMGSVLVVARQRVSGPAPS